MTEVDASATPRAGKGWGAAGVAESLCDLGSGFNCSAVNGSPESEILGILQSVLAMPVYLVAALRTTGVPPGGERRLRELVDELLGG